MKLLCASKGCCPRTTDKELSEEQVAAICVLPEQYVIDQDDCALYGRVHISQTEVRVFVKDADAFICHLVAIKDAIIDPTDELFAASQMRRKAAGKPYYSSKTL